MIELWPIGILCIAVALFLLGRNFGVYRFVRRRRVLEGKVDNLEAFQARYDAKLDEDPQRVAIDHGKRFVTTRMQALIDTITEELDDR
jgi:hypothetical protein